MDKEIFNFAEVMVVGVERVKVGGYKERRL